jgi:hypothetical protein
MTGLGKEDDVGDGVLADKLSCSSILNLFYNDPSFL